MPEPFVLSAQLQIAAPSSASISTLRTNIKKQLGNLNAVVNLKVGSTSKLDELDKKILGVSNSISALNSQSKTTATNLQQMGTAFAGIRTNLANIGPSLNKVNTSFTSVGKAINTARHETVTFSEQAGLAARRFLAFSLPTTAIFAFTKAISVGVKEIFNFERELIKIAQSTDRPINTLSSLSNTVSNLSVQFGVSSSELIKSAKILTQAGFTAKEAEKALTALAKTDLAPSFESIAESTEGAISIFQQFGKNAERLEADFGAINAVAAKYAVESSDIITAIQKTGGAFKVAGGNLNELIGLFTSVRQTTRESADTIAVAFRTIFTRLQRPETIDFLRKFNIELEQSGKFVGPVEAIKRIGAVVNQLGQGDLRVAAIAEEIGGLRQISKTIPLLQQAALGQEAINTAIQGTTSLTEDSEQALQGFLRQVSQVKEEFLALFREIGQTRSFQVITSTLITVLNLANQVLRTFKELVPLLVIGGSFFATRGLVASGGVTGFLSKFTRRDIPVTSPFAAASGGVVPGPNVNKDIVPSMLMPGEFVLNKAAVAKVGLANLTRINNSPGSPRQQGGISFFGPESDLGPLVNAIAAKLGREVSKVSINTKTSQVGGSALLGSLVVPGALTKGIDLRQLTSAVAGGTINPLTGGTTGPVGKQELTLISALSAGVKQFGKVVAQTTNIIRQAIPVQQATAVAQTALFKDAGLALPAGIGGGLALAPLGANLTPPQSLPLNPSPLVAGGFRPRPRVLLPIISPEEISQDQSLRVGPIRRGSIPSELEEPRARRIFASLLERQRAQVQADSFGAKKFVPTDEGIASFLNKQDLRRGIAVPLSSVTSGSSSPLAGTTFDNGVARLPPEVLLGENKPGLLRRLGGKLSGLRITRGGLTTAGTLGASALGGFLQSQTDNRASSIAGGALFGGSVAKFFGAGPAGVGLGATVGLVGAFADFNNKLRDLTIEESLDKISESFKNLDSAISSQDNALISKAASSFRTTAQSNVSTIRQESGQILGGFEGFLRETFGLQGNAKEVGASLKKAREEALSGNVKIVSSALTTGRTGNLRTDLGDSGLESLRAAARTRLELNQTEFNRLRDLDIERGATPKEREALKSIISENAGLKSALATNNIEKLIEAIGIMSVEALKARNKITELNNTFKDQAIILDLSTDKTKSAIDQQSRIANSNNFITGLGGGIGGFQQNSRKLRFGDPNFINNLSAFSSSRPEIAGAANTLAGLSRARNAIAAGFAQGGFKSLLATPQPDESLSNFINGLGLDRNATQLLTGFVTRQGGGFLNEAGNAQTALSQLFGGEEISSLLDSFNEGIQAQTDALNNHADIMKNIAEFSQRILGQTQTVNSSIQTAQLTVAELQSRRTGQTVSSIVGNVGFNTFAQNQGLLGGGLDPTQIGANAINRIRNLQGFVSGGGGNTTQGVSAIIGEQTAINNLVESLKNLTDPTNLAADAIRELSEVEEERAARLGLLNNFLGQGRSGQNTLLRTAQNAQQFAAGGAGFFDTLSNQRQRELLDFISSNGGVSIGGRRLSAIAEQQLPLTAGGRRLEALGFGVGGLNADRDNLIDEIAAANNIAVEAQKQLLEILRTQGSLLQDSSVGFEEAVTGFTGAVGAFANAVDRIPQSIELRGINEIQVNIAGTNGLTHLSSALQREILSSVANKLKQVIPEVAGKIDRAFS